MTKHIDIKGCERVDFHLGDGFSEKITAYLRVEEGKIVICIEGNGAILIEPRAANCVFIRNKK